MARSPATDRIVKASVIQFAESGYDASSMNNIADAVGIRKASLYAHFTSKDALFMAAFNDVVTAERHFAAQCFQAAQSPALPGSHYCTALVNRYAETPDLQFFLRSSYMPPTHLMDQINTQHEAYLTQLEQSFMTQLDAWKMDTQQFSTTQQQRFIQAYLGIVDSLQVKLIYTTAAQSKLRLDALFSILEDALYTAQRITPHGH